MAFRREEEYIEFEEGQKYTGRQMEVIADQLLRADSKTEMCRECSGRGSKTGDLEVREQDAQDAEGNQLFVEYDEFVCENDHRWFTGEGSVRGIAGEDPILFEEHFQSRKRREIYCALGTPDPSITMGLYNRTHPGGRKVNSPEQRKKNGASWYRAMDPLPLILLDAQILFIGIALFLSVNYVLMKSNGGIDEIN